MEVKQAGTLTDTDWESSEWGYREVCVGGHPYPTGKRGGALHLLTRLGWGQDLRPHWLLWHPGLGVEWMKECKQDGAMKFQSRDHVVSIKWQHASSSHQTLWVSKSRRVGFERVLLEYILIRCILSSFVSISVGYQLFGIGSTQLLQSVRLLICNSRE